MRRIIAAACFSSLVASSVWLFAGQAPQPSRSKPVAPAPPAQYQVTLRYRIVAPRDEHAVFYDQIVERLNGLGFVFEPSLNKRIETDRVDPNLNEFHGKVPADNLRRLRDNRFIGGIIAAPIGMDLDKTPPEQPLRVRLELVSGLPAERQRELAEQTKLLLATLGFEEAAGYDDRGVTGQPFTKLMGTLPKGQLHVLLKDLRDQPNGWFGPRMVRAELPMPLRLVDPILYTEVLNDPEPIKDAAAPASRTPTYLDKIGPGLWEIVNDKDKEQQLVRAQVVFAGTLSPAALRQRVRQGAPNAFVEGVLEQYVTVEIPVSQIKDLAALQEVLAIRLPTPARGDVDPNLPGVFELAKVLQLSGLDQLHKQGSRGQGVRLAILDTDFRGWREQVKAGKLSAKTQFVDLTTERSQDLLPAPEPTHPPLGKGGVGHGTQCALAAALAAPDAELVLVRIAGDEPYQVSQVSKSIRGPSISAILERRLDELRLNASLLDLRRNQLVKERRAILQDFRDEQEARQDFGFLGAVYGWIFSEREWHRQQMDYQDELERDLAAKERRYWKLVEQIHGLKGIGVVANPRAWNDGYPLGAAGPLSRAFDSQMPGALWFQAAGDTAGQAWTGMYRDVDGNGVMEFTDATGKLPPGRWTSELNFLAWQPHDGKQSPILPDKATLHVSLQWREPHDPDYYLKPGEEDGYRQPLAQLKLVLLRQRDPEGKTLGADDFEVVARSRAVAGRLDHQPGGSVYEQVLDYTITKPGRYALRVETPPAANWVLMKTPERYYFDQRQGLTATSIRPLGAPTLPGVDRAWELRPRLFIEATDDMMRLQGRPVLADFATEAGAVGMPGDARTVITVGAAGLDGRPQPYSANGPPPFVDLAAKPSIWAYDAVRQGNGPARGTSLATAFAAGTAAAVLSSGVNRTQLLERLQQQRGEVFCPAR